MGSCIYCGKAAGIFRNKHNSCEERRNQGWSQLIEITRNSILEDKPSESLKKKLEDVAKESFIPASRLEDALVKGWESAVDYFLEDGHLSESQEKLLKKFCNEFSLTQNKLNSRGLYNRFVKGVFLRDIMNGVLTSRLQIQGHLPFNFQKTEKLVWVFPNTKYSEDRRRRHFEGGHQGVSIRIARGLY